MKYLKKIKISGKVQGVFFRASAKKKAEELGIHGIVKNESDGTVFAEAEGETEALDDFISWCHQGPPGARVDTVEVWDGEIKNYAGFQINR